MDIVLDKQLKKDSILLGSFEDSFLLLMRNSLFPWFVLVPYTNETEFHNLGQEMQLSVLGQINFVSKFIENNYKTDKINIGAIGNIVSQLHVHIIGRRKDDACWPNVVWGGKQFKHYQPQQVEEIKEKIILSCQDNFQAAEPN